MGTQETLAWNAIYSEVGYFSIATINLTLSLLPYSSIILFGFIAFFIAGLVKGITGLGLPITAISILGLVIDIRFAVCLVIVPIIFTNLIQLLSNTHRLVLVKKYWRLISSMAVVTFFTSGLILSLSLSAINVLMGVCILVFVLFSLLKRLPIVPDQHQSQAQYATGIATGVLGGTTGLVVVPITIYLTLQRLPREEFIAAACPIFLLGGFALLVGFTNAGLLSKYHVALSSLMVMPALLGTLVGEILGNYLSERLFRHIVLSIFALTAASLIYTGMSLVS